MSCYAIRLIKPFMSVDVLRSAYFLYVRSIISYEIIFWGNSSHSEKIFKIQKRIIRIIMNSSKNASCRQLLKELNILPIQSQYIFLILLFVIKSKDQFLFKSQVHKNKYKTNFRLPSANLTIYQNGVDYSEIKIHNHLPTAIKDLSDDKNIFKLALKSLVNETNLVHNLFSLYFFNFIYNLFMFRTSPRPSSVGTTVFMQHLVVFYSETSG